MKKLIALTFAMLFIGVGIASATDFSMTGSYEARGTYYDNETATGVSGAKNLDYGVYDHEMNLETTWKISPATKIYAKLEIRDEQWAVATNATESTQGETDDNIAVELLYAQHWFSNGIGVRVGLVPTSVWSTNFGNDGTEAYRVELAKMTKLGYLLGFAEKGQGGREFLNSDNDIDTYFVGLVSKKFNNISFHPSAAYVDAEIANWTMIKGDLGIVGQFNNVGFEAEFIYSDYDRDNANDYAVYGAYMNVWTQINKLKVGAVIAYGSYDDDTGNGFAFEDDFECAGAMLLGDEALMGGVDSIEAATLYVLYASYAATEKLTLSAYAGFAESNVDDPNNAFGDRAFDGADIWEVNVQGSYAITPNVTYSVGAANAQMEYGDNTADPDNAVEIFHKLAFTF